MALVDPFRFGHHEVELDALLTGLITRGQRVVCFSPPEGPGALWQAERPDLVDHVAVAIDDAGADPALPRHVDQEARRRGVDRLVLLPSGQYLQPTAPIWTTSVPTTFTVHRLKGLHAQGLRRLRAWSSVRERRARLRSMGSPPNHVLVHTQRAVELAGSCGVRATMARYPLAPPLEGSRRVPAEPRRVLFVGGLRAWKGAALLPQAWRQMPDPPLLHLVGNDAHDDPAVVEALAGLPVERDGGHQDRESVEVAFARASLVVAPYDHTYPRTGATVSVPLEALLRNTPVVVSDAVADQLPPGAPGAVVVATDDAAALARGVTEALDRIEELTAQTADAATWVRHHHGIGTYLEALGCGHATGMVSDP